MLQWWNSHVTCFCCQTSLAPLESAHLRPSNLPGLIRLPERSPAPPANTYTSRASSVVSAGTWNYPWLWRVPLHPPSPPDHPPTRFDEELWLCAPMLHGSNTSVVFLLHAASFPQAVFAWFYNRNLHYVQSKSYSFIILSLSPHLPFKFSKKNSTFTFFRQNPARYFLEGGKNTECTFPPDVMKKRCVVFKKSARLPHTQTNRTTV